MFQNHQWRHTWLTNSFAHSQHALIADWLETVRSEIFAWKTASKMQRNSVSKQEPPNKSYEHYDKTDWILQKLQIYTYKIDVTYWIMLYITRSSAIAEGLRDASCQLKSCQLPRNSAETNLRQVLTKSKLWSWRVKVGRCACALNRDAFESLSLSYRCHKQTDDGRVVHINCIPTTCCGEIF